jgi:hypothetical protein
MRSSNPIVTVDLTERAYAMDCAEKLLVSLRRVKAAAIYILNSRSSARQIAKITSSTSTRLIKSGR